MLTLEIETIHAGQPRPYADSFYEYVITTNQKYSGELIKSICTKVLRPCKQTKEEWQKGKGDMGSYFEGYYTFEKIDDYKYRYYKLEPYTD